jgi:hypothetical protein
MDFMQFVSGAGAVLLWGLAAIVACVVFKAAFSALGWITDRVLQLTGKAYAGIDPINCSLHGQEVW